MTLIAKLQVHGFDNDSLNFICNYLLDREHGIKINSSFSTWSKIEYGVPQGFILGPLLFNVNTLYMFFEHKDTYQKILKKLNIFRIQDLKNKIKFCTLLNCPCKLCKTYQGIF